MKAKDENRPVNEIRIGSIRVTIWLNPQESGAPRYNVTASRSYKNKEGDWRDVNSYDYADMPSLVEVLQQAKSWLRDRIELDSQENVFAAADAMDEGSSTKVSNTGRKKRRSK
jgi:hypothetical protein